MKISIVIIDWEYPEQRLDFKPEIMDLHNKSHLMELYLGLANGVILEAKAAGESDEALDVLRGMVKGAGSCVRVELTEEEKQRLWLFEEGFECYRQGVKDPGYIFINPLPQPFN